MPTTTPAPDQIAEAAYYLWLEEGRPEGRDAEHWNRAEAALGTPKRKRAAPKPATPAKPRTRKAQPKDA